MLYVMLKGELGDQLFGYAAAESVKRKYSESIICLNTGAQIHDGYRYSLSDYDLNDIELDINTNEKEYRVNFKQHQLLRLYYQMSVRLSFRGCYNGEKLVKRMFNRAGLYCVQHGYIPQGKLNAKGLIYLNGYFASPKYFEDIEEDIKKIIVPKKEIRAANDELRSKILSKNNTVCMDFRSPVCGLERSHNVCTKEYYRKAITIAKERIKNPIFYVFTDKDEYSNANVLFDSSDTVDVIPEFELESSKLYVMSACQHFILHNNTLSWWAQFLSENTGKKVIAPRKWFSQDVPCDLYEDDWILIN